MKDDWIAIKELGNIEYTNSNYLKSIELYTKAISLASNEDVLYSNRALCYIKVEDLSNAITDLNQAIKINPNNIKALKNLHLINLRLGRLNESIYFLKLLENIEKGQDEIFTKLEQLIEKEEKLKFEFNNGHFHNSSVIGLEILRECKDYFQVKCIIIESLLKINKVQEGIDMLKTCFRKDERNQECVVYLTALAYYYEGNYPECKKLLKVLCKKGLKIEKYELLLSMLISIEEVKNSAKASFEREDYDIAFEKYMSIIMVDSTNFNLLATIYSNICICKMKKKRFKEALNYVNISLNYNPNNINALYRRGLINIELGNTDDAEKDFKMVLEIDPSKKEAKLKLEECEMQRELKDKKDYYKILDVSTTASDVEIRDAYRKLAKKWHPDKHSQDEKALEKSKQMFEEITEAYDVLKSYDKRNTYDSARIYLEDDANFNEFELISKKAGGIYYNKK